MTRLSIASTWDGRPLPIAEHAAVELALEPAWLRIRILAPFHGDPAPPTLPGATPGLWEHEVVELFLAGSDGRYVEVEVGPHGHHLVLFLDGVRRPLHEALPLRARVQRGEGWWASEARLARSWVPEGPHTANAYRIHGVGADRRYLAAHAVPGPAPDFHQPARFAPVQLPAAEEVRGSAWVDDILGTRS